MTARPKFLACGDYLPDLPDFSAPGGVVAENVVPRSRTTYGPMPAFARIASSALNSAPLGAFSARDSSGNPGNYAGTTTKLYRATNSTNPNYADSSAFAYATPSGGFWSFTEGDGYVYASNGFDPIQRVATAAAANFATVSANAPIAKVIAAIQPGFLLCGDINDVTVGIQPQGLRWSALGDFTSWPVVGSAPAIAAESDWQKVSGPHGRLLNIAPDLVTANAGLFFERGIFRMVYTGTNKIFDITPVEKERGIAAATSLVQAGQIAYYLGADGFYSFDGTLARPIGADQVNKTFYADCDPNYVGSVSGVMDPSSGLIFWSYAGVGNNNGIPNRILVYNPIVGRFSLISGFTGYSLFIARAFGTSLDGIDALGWTLDSLPFSLDSPLLAGGRIVLGGFGTDFKYGTFSGANMAFTVDTPEFSSLFPGLTTRVKAVRPMVQGTGASIQVGSRASVTDAVTYSPTYAPDAAGLCHPNRVAMFNRIRIIGPSGHSCQHIQGAMLQDYSPGGKR